MDQIKQQLDQLAELSDEQVVELQSTIVSEFETVEGEEPSSQTVDAMTALADMLDTVRAEVQRREAAVEELSSRAAEAAMRVKGADSTDGEQPMAEGAPETDEGTPEEEAKDAADGEMPADEMKKKPVAAASIVSDEGSELSTTNPDEETTVEETEPVVADASIDATGEEAAAVIEADATAEASTTDPETLIAQEEQKEQEAPVTAAGTDEPFEAPADRRPVVQVTEAPVAITAGADIPGYTAGSSMNNMTDVAEAMAKRLHGLRRVNGGDGEQHIVASLTTSYPEDRILTTDALSNAAKIEALTSPQAIVASGGHVAPFQAKYDVFGIGTNSRPVRDALVRFNVDRGGIRFVTPPKLATYGASVSTTSSPTGVWTASNDAAASPSPATKGTYTVVAATENTVATDAVTLQLQFGNLSTRAYPELIARHNELGLIQHARTAENYLLTAIENAGTAVSNGTNLLGAARDILVQVGRAAAAFRTRHRMDSEAPLRLVIPSWVKGAIRADLALQMPGDSALAVTNAEIDGYFAARHINVTETLDSTGFASQGAAALVEFPDSFKWHLFPEGSFLFLDGGTLDIGIIRDSTLVGTNDYKMFMESFEGIAFVGVESLTCTHALNVNGIAAALRDTTGGATAAAIEL